MSQTLFMDIAGSHARIETGCHKEQPNEDHSRIGEEGFIDITLNLISFFLQSAPHFVVYFPLMLGKVWFGRGLFGNTKESSY
jgi:hypothetical protein